jgi:enoyl-CoA hydratase
VKPDDLLFEAAGGIAWVTFNRPEVRNAITADMADELVEICNRVALDRSIRVLVLKGAGGRAFASGADLAEQGSLVDEPTWRRFLNRWAGVCEAVETVPLPTIAAIQGVCSGGGATLANCCDFRVAAPSARYGYSNARLTGGGFSRGNVLRLVTLVGVPRATELLLKGYLLSAPEALAAGAFTEVVAGDESLLPRVRELAAELAANAPITLRTAKSSLLGLRQSVPADNLEPALEAYLSEDFQEGLRAFREKRRPEWRGV